MALDLEAALYIKRVPTKENLADDPSRERYGLLQRMQASSDQFFYIMGHVYITFVYRPRRWKRS